MIELQPESVIFVRAFLATTVGILVLFVGKALNQRVGLLREYNIPEPVTGGLLFAVAFWALYLASGYRLVFELQVRDVLLVYFFTTIGLNARINDLKAGGRPLLILSILVAMFLFVQDVVGIGIAKLFGWPPAMGLIVGSISLLGGHGTAIAWAPVLAARPGLENALEVGVLCATAGLVLASVAGGPLACRHHDRAPFRYSLDLGLEDLEFGRVDDVVGEVDREQRRLDLLQAGTRIVVV